MKFITDSPFILQSIFKWNGSFNSKSRILVNGRCTRYKVDGKILYKCVQIHSDYVLFVTDEELSIYVANIYLLDMNGRVIDKAKIYAAYLEDDLSAFFNLIEDDTYSGELTDFRCLCRI
ncbi:unnamed protein product [Commensalibacter communis]|uniref:Uncharacterized protein n=1 Tax=Commensalibacter communis TaxID=2972786 RepID=A0A9W4TPE0_9PROT|nr:unnamed protein product [Commensalibacter communis]CAI3941148.1 unnamed protein product [Commensalibacter communis]CAI3942339.1 unnamed protein product [Commensalibacter communis]CAI3947424.1 unnamed protein product [Commensalibacter communis]CAI3947485.1 unnamed protein product [Commensalibacter communis]